MKQFYINDVILYYKNTYKKVSKLYDEYKARKSGHACKNTDMSLGMGTNSKLEHDMHLDEFMKENELYFF